VVGNGSSGAKQGGMEHPSDPHLKGRGPLSRSEAFALIVGAPFLSILLVVEGARIWGAINGAPLLITGLFGLDIAVRRSDGVLPIVLGATLHGVIILWVIASLWSLLGLFQRWLEARRHQA